MVRRLNSRFVETLVGSDAMTKSRCHNVASEVKQAFDKQKMMEDCPGPNSSLFLGQVLMKSLEIACTSEAH